ncbi:MAG TPA: hypothetical protein VFY48_11620 [Solirubrobacterales bacterium]|nr:hypothetical protein [Solirubrobacterales bacterium]
MGRSVLAIVPDALQGDEEVDEVRRVADGEGTELRIVVPAVEATIFRHTMGDIDEPKQQAEERLEASLASLRESGIEASGEVGDPDPVQAAQDALLKAPADEILIFEREEQQARWFEEGLFEKAQAALEPPLRMVVVHSGDADGEHVVAVEEAGRGTDDKEEEDLHISSNFPPLSSRDLAGIVFGIVGTILVAILASAVASGPGPEAGWKAVAIGIAIFTGLINMAHVVGLTLFESVRYRGGFAVFFRDLSLIGTSAAILIVLGILVLT